MTKNSLQPGIGEKLGGEAVEVPSQPGPPSITAQDLVDALSEANVWEEYFLASEAMDGRRCACLDGYWDLEEVARALNRRLGR